MPILQNRIQEIEKPRELFSHYDINTTETEANYEAMTMVPT